MNGWSSAGVKRARRARYHVDDPPKNASNNNAIDPRCLERTHHIIVLMTISYFDLE